MAMTAITKRVARKLFTDWRSIAGFIKTNDAPQAIETVKSAHGASFSCSW
jgi:hypothetical protein